eukprot:3409978-Amphidinium_carterae.1
MDKDHKAKVAYPQYAFDKTKELAAFVRPKLVVTAVIAHGYCTDFYIAEDEVIFHGASTFMEILVRTLDRVSQICVQEGVTFPRHLWLQSDNTTSQGKKCRNHPKLGFVVGAEKVQNHKPKLSPCGTHPRRH